MKRIAPSHPRHVGTGPHREPELQRPVWDKFASLLDEDDVSLRAVAAFVDQHPSLMAFVIEQANSSTLGLSRLISSVQHAVTLLGQRRLQIAVASQRLRDELKLNRAA